MGVSRGRLRAAAPMLLLLLSGLPALAYASPPDPSWVGGIYDGADYDDVIDAITSTTASPSPLFGADLRPILALVDAAPPTAEDAVLALPWSSLQSRAPPACSIPAGGERRG